MAHGQQAPSAHPNLNLLKEDPQKIPLWVKFYGVPLEYWTPSSLSHVASAVGRPLHTDGLTAAKSRISFARICVEINASDDFVEEFYLQCENGDWITVFAELEWAPTRCSMCKVFGHSDLGCTRKGKQTSIQPSKPNSEEEWTEVKKRRKRKEVLVAPPVSAVVALSQVESMVSEGLPQDQAAPLHVPPGCEDSSGQSDPASPSPSSGSRQEFPILLVAACSTPPHSSLGQDPAEPLTASTDLNPLSRLAEDSMDKEGLAQNPQKGKNKSSYPPPLEGPKEVILSSCVPLSFCQR